MRYIFPRQYGLHNVFTSTVDKRETTMPFKDYTLREKEIHQAMCREVPEGKRNEEALTRWKQRVPKRLRGDAVALISKLRKLNKRCSYMELLRHYCPVEVNIKIAINRVRLTSTGTPSVPQTGLEEKHTSAER